MSPYEPVLLDPTPALRAKWAVKKARRTWPRAKRLAARRVAASRARNARFRKSGGHVR